MAKSYSEITEQASAIFNSFKDLHDDARRRYSLYTLRRSPVIAEDIAREGQVNVLSPLIIHSAHTIRADLMMNPTEFMVTPLARDTGGSIIKDHVRKGDNLEKALAILWSQVNEGRRVDREIIWHQLVSPFGVMVLEAEEPRYPDQGNLSNDEYLNLIERHKLEMLPWNISTPDPTTCAFTEYRGKPTVFVRKYKQLVRDVERNYSRRKSTPHHDADLKLGSDGVFKWEKISEDYDRSSYRQGVNSIREVEMVWLDDGENIYHVALNPGAPQTGTVVWEGKNPFGRVSAFIVGSNVTPMRNPEDRWEPYLWPLMQTVEQLNVIRTTRATAARNESGPDDYIVMDPQTIQLFEKMGKELPMFQQFKRNNNEVPYLYGKMESRVSQTSIDFDKLEMRLNEDLQRFLPSSFVNVLDPAVIKAATASAILNAAEAGLRMYGPLMSAYDAQIKEVMEAILHCAEFHFKGEEFSFYSSGEEMARGKNIKAGSGYALSDKNLDFPYRLTVKTRSMTQAQASAQYDLALKQRTLPDGTPGPVTLGDLIDAANYSDKAAQLEAIASEQILRSIDPFLQQMAMAAAVVEIEATTGMKLPLGNEPLGGAEQSPSRLPNSAQRMDAPMVTGPEGGSDVI